MMGAVTMKMTKRTSITSTIGVTFIWEIVTPFRCEEESKAIGPSFELLFETMPFRDVEKLVRKVVHICCQHLDAFSKMIISHERRDGGRQSGCSGNQSLRDAGSHRLNARGMRHAKPTKGIHNSPNCSKQPNKWRGAGGG